MTGREVVDLVFALSIPITIIVFWIWQKLSHQKAIREWEAFLKDAATQREKDGTQ
jgi:hypothetical protein